MFLLWYASHDPDCKLRLKKDTMLASGYGLALNKKLHSTTELMNKVILQQRETDEIYSFLSKWFIETCKLNENIENSRLGVTDFGGLIILLIVVSVVSFPVLIPERFYYKYLNDKLTVAVKRFFQNKNVLSRNATLSTSVDKSERDFEEKNPSMPAWLKTQS